MKPCGTRQSNGCKYVDAGQLDVCCHRITAGCCTHRLQALQAEYKRSCESITRLQFLLANKARDTACWFVWCAPSHERCGRRPTHVRASPRGEQKKSHKRMAQRSGHDSWRKATHSRQKSRKRGKKCRDYVRSCPSRRLPRQLLQLPRLLRLVTLLLPLVLLRLLRLLKLLRLPPRRLFQPPAQVHPPQQPHHHLCPPLLLVLLPTHLCRLLLPN